jgi:hypothetical protein
LSDAFRWWAFISLDINALSGAISRSRKKVRAMSAEVARIVSYIRLVFKPPVTFTKALVSSNGAELLKASKQAVPSAAVVLTEGRLRVAPS